MITNYRDYKTAWKMVAYLQKTESSRNQYKGFIDFVKRDIREYRDQAERSPIVSSIDEGYGYWTTLEMLPTEITNKADAEEYFENMLRREAMPSQYDCTGQVFTVRHTIYQRESDGRFMCWHSMAMDV